MFDHHVSVIQKTMDVSALKRKVNADNIANYSTPDFKATKVNFDHMFQEAGRTEVSSTRGKHIVPAIQKKEEPLLEQDLTTRSRIDGNNVDLNVEMVDMIKNNYVFNLSVQSFNKESALLKTAIGRQ